MRIQHAAHFASYFFDQPFRYWNRIEVTEAIAKEIKGVSLKLFYRKPVQQDSIWLWQKARHVRDFDFYEEQNPAKNNFKGTTYTLINGFCMSSCAAVAAILSFSKKSIFIGQETGGGYHGNNSGMMPETKIPPFDFTITVPLHKYLNYVDTSRNAGRGTMPDYTITVTIDDILKGQDKELESAIALVKSDRGNCRPGMLTSYNAQGSFRRYWAAAELAAGEIPALMTATPCRPAEQQARIRHTEK